MRLNHLYAVRYGKGFQYGGPDFAFIYYLANVYDTWILIDTGFSSRELANGMGIHLFQVKDDICRMIAPNSVEDILITHSHWDHIDDICNYYDTNIFLSKITYEKALSENCDSTRAYVRKAKEEDRLNFLASGSKILNLFTYELIGGHSEDSGVFYFEQDDRKYCLAGDECFSVNNLMKNIPIENAYNHERNLDFTRYCYENDIIMLPAHDDSIFKNYPKITENIVQVI